MKGRMKSPSSDPTVRLREHPAPPPMRAMRTVAVAALTAAAAAAPTATPNMNGEYMVMQGEKMVAMPPFSAQDPKNEHFDVYSPEIKTLYGQVFWTMMEGTPLPPEIVSRFRNKTMAVVGYECNQVGRMADGTEYEIPINAACEPPFPPWYRCALGVACPHLTVETPRRR
jgi:hypothetical protein